MFPLSSASSYSPLRDAPSSHADAGFSLQYKLLLLPAYLFGSVLYQTCLILCNYSLFVDTLVPTAPIAPKQDTSVAKAEPAACYVHLWGDFMGGLANDFMFTHIAHKIAKYLDCDLVVAHHAPREHGALKYTLNEAVFQRHGDVERNWDLVGASRWRMVACVLRCDVYEL